jgi:hypothetical protein
MCMYVCICTYIPIYIYYNLSPSYNYSLDRKIQRNYVEVYLFEKKNLHSRVVADFSIQTRVLPLDSIKIFF